MNEEQNELNEEEDFFQNIELIENRVNIKSIVKNKDDVKKKTISYSQTAKIHIIEDSYYLREKPPIRLIYIYNILLDCNYFIFNIVFIFLLLILNIIIILFEVTILIYSYNKILSCDYPIWFILLGNFIQNFIQICFIIIYFIYRIINLIINYYFILKKYPKGSYDINLNRNFQLTNYINHNNKKIYVPIKTKEIKVIINPKRKILNKIKKLFRFKW
jgi:hypothetical protein